MRNTLAVCLTGLVGLFSPQATAQDLKLGDPAPELIVSDWVKGAPVGGFERDKVYVVEFWATWCGPCIRSMPHLTDLQAEYKSKGVTIIGVSSEDPNNSLTQVKAMTKTKGDALMGYTVAYDAGRQANADWMQAAQQRGIPTAFVVDGEGNIAYIGHPLFLDLPLHGIDKGEWNAADGAKMVEKASAALSSTLRTPDSAEALKAIEQFGKDFPALANMEMLVTRKYSAMIDQGRDSEAMRVAGKMIKKAMDRKNADMLNEWAWAIVDPDAEIGQRDLALAEKAALEAAKITNRKDASVLDTLARVHAWNGELEKAHKIQLEAVKVADERMKPSLEQIAEDYAEQIRVRG